MPYDGNYVAYCDGDTSPASPYHGPPPEREFLKCTLCGTYYERTEYKNKGGQLVVDYRELETKYDRADMEEYFAASGRDYDEFICDECKDAEH